MNTITHNETLSFIQSVEHVAHRCVTEELDEIDATQLILATVETVADNADKWITFIEVAITKAGYEVRYEVHDGAKGFVDHAFVLDLLERGLEVQREMLLED